MANSSTADDGHGAEAVPAVRGSEATPTEQAIAQVWCEVLGVEAVGPEDSFFALGGNSLVAMRAVIRTRRALGGRQVSLADMFKASDLRGLAELLDRREED